MSVDKEKVRELASRLDFSYGKLREEIITEWLEQNQHKPVVVGLSDEQVDNLVAYMRKEGFLSFLVPHNLYIKDWLKTQTFSHYNNEGKVYELDSSVTDYREAYDSVAGSFVSLEEEY